ncbi:hypothetical protein BJ166DRAFT_92361 [Pestalotiopsis sp. NC0098]|nr:hypothetical protein BJ166DRAFT_92361 [Pestalotiopsis sp. NC0098]
MSSPLDNAIIRSSEPAQQAQYLQKQLESHSWQAISDHLIASIEIDSIPANVFHVWMSVCKNADAIVAAMQQDVSNVARLTAIRRFGKELRKDDSFAAIWSAAGGVDGLAKLMSTFSVQHVATMCETICFSSPARRAVAQRQQAITKLYQTLTGCGDEPNPDTRPLEGLYKRLLPACTVDTVLDHTADRKPGRRIILVHAPAYEQNAMAAMFAPHKSDRKKIDEYTHLFDKNRRFALTVLDRVAKDPSVLHFNGDLIIFKFVEPLLRRLCRVRDRGAIAHVLRVMLECAEKEPRVSAKVAASKLLHYAIFLWRHPHNEKDAEELLTSFVAFTQWKGVRRPTEAMRLLQKVETIRRFELYRLILLHAPSLRVDISLETEAEDKKIANLNVQWPIALFGIFDRTSGLRLFRRFWRIIPEDKLATHFQSIPAGMQYIGGKDMYTMSATLESQVTSYPDETAPWFIRVKNEVSEHMRKATNSREPEDRGRWASSALSLCIATNSLHLLHDTLIWARRFNRDPKTVISLYQSGPLLSSHDLLSGIPSHTHRNLPPLSEIGEAVKKGNEVVSYVLETAAMGIQEPSFQIYSWTSVTHLYQDFLTSRIRRTQKLQERYKILDEDIMNFIWKPTIEFLLKMERFLLQPENEKLCLQVVHGPFKFIQNREVEATTSTCRFLNEMAEKRNQLFVEIRPTLHPAVANLSKPWPRGLPVQSLCPIPEKAKIGVPPMPYLDERCRDVVFFDSSAFNDVPEDDEIQEAIGTFQDSYKFAFEHYLRTATDEEDRDQRLRKAWSHVIDMMPESRMSKTEAVDFWEHFFNTLGFAGVQDGLKRLGLAPDRKVAPLELPEPDVDGMPVEWTPWPTGKMAVQPTSKTLDPVCLDHMLSISTDLHSSTIKQWFLTAWSHVRPPQRKVEEWSLSSASKEASIAAAIAYINTKYGSDSSLTLKPFPTAADARYPALYLDQEFLEAYKNDDARRPLDVLSSVGAHLPVSLLHRLAQSLMQRLESTEKKDPALLKTTMAVLKILVRSDRPRIASQLVQHIVLDRDDDSSWHRHLLNTGYLRQLSASDASAVVTDLSTEMSLRHKKLVEQNAKRKAEKEHSAVLVSPPETQKGEKDVPVAHTRVSTIKMVAQILEDADFIDGPTVCDVLGTLLNSSSHPDVRIAIVDSLTSMLGKTKQAKLRSRFYDALEKHIIPIASSINERTPPREKDWLEAENGDGPLPEVYDAEPINQIPSLLSRLVAAADLWPKESPEYHEWVTRILFPVFEESAAQNARWNALFAKRHKLNIAAQSLPAIPVKPELLLEFWGNIPQARNKSNLELFKQYLLVNLRPDEGLEAARKAVRADSNLRSSNAGAHWLHLWGGATIQGKILPHFVRVLLEIDAKTESETIEGVQAFTAQLLTDCISRSEVREFESIIGIIDAPKAKRQDQWRDNCLPVVEKAIRGVDELRTQEWQNDPHRKPDVLPRTMAAKRTMLKGKYSNRDGVLSKEEMDEFVGEYCDLIDELVADNEPYHDEWKGFSRLAQYDLWRYEQYFAMAMALARRINVRSPTLADYLKTQMASDLLRPLLRTRPLPLGDEDVAAFRAVMTSWVATPAERIRVCGRELETALEDYFEEMAEEEENE